MRMVVLGSCLSSLTIEKVSLIENGLKFRGIFSHLRSDVVLELMGGSTIIGCSSLDVDKVYTHFESMIGSEHQKRMLLKRVSKQSSVELAKLEVELKECDVLVFDNNYDLGRHVCDLKIDDYRCRFSNLNIPEDAVGVDLLPVLEPDQIRQYELAIIEKITELNPDVKIVFLNYPVTAFEKRAKLADIFRVNKARYVNQFMREGIERGNIPENVTFIGCIDLPEKLLSNKGALYFQDEVYQTFAKLIEAKVDGKIKGRYFDDFTALQKMLGLASTDSAGSSTKTPYADLSDRQYWKPAVAEPYPLAITDLYRKKFDIGIDDAVATCGSCFAQHIGKRLDRKGYNYMDVEPIPEGLSADKAKALGYGIYSARYGNVYTSRQLIQLFERAYGELDFDEVWMDKKGRYVDPFRPNLCGEGYTTAEEVLHEQRLHLSNVRHMFETLDVFVFTMGVTETWINRQSGAVYPICPGVTAGSFDPDQHEFVNLDYATILEEMETFLSRLRSVNPNAKVLLTVSPVPLTATAEERHVLLSTMASKSILRAVADQLYRRHVHVDYFPSYDIIMSPPYKSMFFKNNLRSIHEEGVDYVMSHFFAQHRLENEADSKPADSSTFHKASPQPESEEDDEAFCDEAFLELERKTAGNNI